MESRILSPDGTILVGKRLKGLKISQVSCEDLIVVSKIDDPGVKEAMNMLLLKILEEGGTRGIIEVLKAIRATKPKVYQADDTPLPF